MSSFVTDSNEEFELQTLLGSGGQGSTYLFKRLSDSQLYTVKSFKKMSEFENEVKILKRFKDPKLCDLLHVPCFIDTFYISSDHELYELFKSHHIVIYQFIKGIPFMNKIKEKGFYSIDLAVMLVDQMLTIIEEIHKMGIAHRDIKPANIIYNPDTELFYLIDFGLSCFEESINCSNFSGTLHYILPDLLLRREILNYENYQRSDLYALGVILYTYLHKHNPFVISLHPYKYKQYKGISEDIPEFLREMIELLMFNNYLGINEIKRRWNDKEREL